MSAIRPPGVRRLAGALAVALVAWLLAMLAPPGTWPWVAPAAAAPAAAPVQVVVDSVSPTVPVPGATLVVSGTLTNVSSAPLRDVGVRLRIGTSPLVSRAGLTAANADPSSVEGPVLAQRPGFVTLGPNSSTTFELSVPLTATTFAAAGVLPLAVESVDGAAALLGAVGTTLLWYPTPGSAPPPTPLTMLWPLVGSAARDATGVVLGGEVGAEFAPGGRLDTLLSTAAPVAAGVTWSIDPQTLEMATVLGAPHQVLADGEPVAEPSSAAATAWLARLRQTVASPGVDAVASGYADPDATGEVAGGLERDLVRATTTAPAEVESYLGRRIADGVSWPPGGVVDDRTLSLLRGAGVSAVVLGQRAVTSGEAGAEGGGLVRLGTDSGPVPAVVGDDDLGASLALLAGGPQWATLARQNFLALTAIAAQDGQDLVAVPPVDWAPPTTAVQQLLTALKAVGLTSPRPLSALLAVADSAPSAQLDATSSATATELAGDPLVAQRMAGVAQINDTIAAIGAITEAPDPAVVPFSSAALRCASAQWRRQPDYGALLLDRTSAQTLALRNRVRISSQGPVAFPGAAGRVPVTVSNDFGVPVKVGVTLEADQAYRLADQAPQQVRIPAGQRISLEVPVTVVGSEPLTVTAKLLTPEGDEYGAGEAFELRTTAYTRVAGWVVAGALALLVVLVVFNVTRRIRKSRKEGGGDGGAT